MPNKKEIVAITNAIVAVSGKVSVIVAGGVVDGD